MPKKTKGKKSSNQKAKNLKAFQEVIDAYEEKKFSSKVSIMDTSKDTHGTVNPATPTATDFFCDVDLQIKKVIKSQSMLNEFFETYIMHNIVLPKADRNYVENELGKLFRQAKIWPVNKYFATIKGKVCSQ